MESGILSRICKMRKETCAPHECTSGVYVGLEHIDSGRFRLSRHGAPSEVRSAKSRFYPGDVLYGKLRPYLDKAVVAETEGICSTDILVLEPLEAPSWFLCGVLHTDPFIDHAKQTTHGVNHPRTSWSGITVFESPSLPHSEQKKIATVLLKIQRAIEMQEKIIQSLRDLKKSTMQHLFTHGLRGEKTKMTEIGEIPESWEVDTLGTVCKIKSGYAFRSSEFTTHGLLVVKIGNLQNGTLVTDKRTSYWLPSKLNDQVERFLLNTGDVLIALTGATTGKLATVPREFDGALLNQRVGKFFIRDGTTFNLDYGRFYFGTSQFQESINRHILQSAQGNISPQKLESIRIPMPSNDEQTDIALSLQVIDMKFQSAGSKRSALKDLFKTTLNKLMVGEIRVNNLDIDVSEIE